MLFAIAYPVVGVAFAVPANATATHGIRFGWRLAAWLVSAAIFATHIWYERARDRKPLLSALHVAIAVATGALLLAVWINVRRPAPLALVLFPLVTGVPAFVVAFVAAIVIKRR